MAGYINRVVEGGREGWSPRARLAPQSRRPHRLARGEDFTNYIKQKYAAQHKGHDDPALRS
jgi:hypothetical protein